MQINSQFPVPASGGFSHSLPVTSSPSNAVQAQSLSAQNSSSVQEFDRVMSQQESRFSPYGQFSFQTQNALNAYQATESLASDNPRASLVGVDIFA
ncbi:hypothetical protein [Marinomonas epiphytica]